MLLGIVIVEYCVAKYIATHYISADPNYIKYHILDMLWYRQLLVLLGD